MLIGAEMMFKLLIGGIGCEPAKNLQYDFRVAELLAQKWT